MPKNRELGTFEKARRRAAARRYIDSRPRRFAVLRLEIGFVLAILGLLAVLGLALRLAGILSIP